MSIWFERSCPHPTSYSSRFDCRIATFPHGIVSMRVRARKHILVPSHCRRPNLFSSPTSALSSLRQPTLMCTLVNAPWAGHMPAIAPLNPETKSTSLMSPRMSTKKSSTSRQGFQPFCVFLPTRALNVQVWQGRLSVMGGPTAYSSQGTTWYLTTHPPQNSHIFSHQRLHV